jgi:hypothetical protein
MIETLICGLLTCAQNKRYILGTNSEIRKSLQRIKNMEKYKQTTLMYNISARRATESDYGLITKKQTFRV